MIVAIDNTFLTLLLNPKAKPRANPTTGEATNHIKEKIEALIDELSGKRGTMLVPAPALAEALSASPAMEAYIEDLQQYACIEIAAFDGIAAYEFGRIIRNSIAAGDKRSGQSGTWQHLKMDRQIVAIAVSRSVDVFYSDDARQISFAKKSGLKVKSTWDLDLPANFAQIHMSTTTIDQWPEHKRPPKQTDLDQ